VTGAEAKAEAKSPSALSALRVALSFGFSALFGSST